MALSDHLFVQAMVQEGSGQTVLSAFPHAQTRLGVGGSGKKILLYLIFLFFIFFVLTNVRHPHVCMFGHVLLELAWVDRNFCV